MKVEELVEVFKNKFDMEEEECLEIMDNFRSAL